MKLEIEATADSRWGTNSYLVEDVDTHDAVVIDANLEPEDILAVARRRGANVRAILLTHTDGDHIAGLPRLLEELGDIPVAVHPSEQEVITGGKPLRANSPMVIDPLPRALTPWRRESPTAPARSSSRCSTPRATRRAG